eukprot:Gb_22063 [translate_table: standard]
MAIVATGNPDRPVDGINTIVMLLTSVTTDTEVGCQGVLAEDEARDPDYILLTCLRMRQWFRCGGVLDGLNVIIMSLKHILMRRWAVDPFNDLCHLFICYVCCLRGTS